MGVALAMTQNRRTKNRLLLSTLTEDEHMQDVIDTTQLESATTTAPELLLQMLVLLLLHLVLPVLLQGML